LLKIHNITLGLLGIKNIISIDFIVVWMKRFLQTMITFAIFIELHKTNLDV
jgi:hypothetical protein